MTETKKYGSTISNELLELIHTDISRSYSSTLCGNKYFITFIDNILGMGMFFLIKEKSSAFEKFDIFKTKSEK